MEKNIRLRPAEPADFQALSMLVNNEFYVHRHLDWRSPLDWLANRPFWILESAINLQMKAALSLAVDPPGVAWVRLFAAGGLTDLLEVWQELLPPCLEELRSQQPKCIIAAVVVHTWFERLLQQSGFRHTQDIVVLSWNDRPLPVFRLPPDLMVREIQEEDLEEVHRLDNLAFSPLWSLSYDGLRRAFQQSAYSTLLIENNEIVGYQITTASDFSAHLARLAVHPRLQRRGIGRAIVADMLTHFADRGVIHITVNTQSDNTSSLTLYQHLGFERTQETLPVFVYPEI